MEDYQIQGRLDEFDRRISQIENSAQSNNSWDSPDRKFDEIDRRIQEMQYTIDDLKNKSNSF